VCHTDKEVLAGGGAKQRCVDEHTGGEPLRLLGLVSVNERG